VTKAWDEDAPIELGVPLFAVKEVLEGAHILPLRLKSLDPVNPDASYSLG
jgi:hypothetical protein